MTLRRGAATGPACAPARATSHCRVSSGANQLRKVGAATNLSVLVYEKIGPPAPAAPALGA